MLRTEGNTIHTTTSSSTETAVMTIDEEALHISQSTEDPPGQHGRRSISVGAAATAACTAATASENDVK